MLVQQRRRRSTMMPGTALVSGHAGFWVGQEVTCGSIHGRITKIVMSPFWKFAVVEDVDGQSHACDFEDLT